MTYPAGGEAALNSEAAPSVTACILSWNRSEDLRRTLDHVLAPDMGGLEVFVIDNGSTDGSREMLNEEYSPSRYPRLTVLHLDENIGIAARNIFFEKVRTDFLLTLDDDSWPRSAEDVDLMLSIMSGDGRIASVCAECVHPDTHVAETRGIERFAAGGDRTRGYDVVNIAAGGSLLRMSAIRETDGYDADFFWGREENDLAFQLVAKDRRILYAPEAVIYHAFSPHGRDNYERLFRVTRNSYWLLWKYFPAVISLPTGLLFALRRLLATLRERRRLRPVLRGIAAGFGGYGRMSRKHSRFTLAQSWKLRHWFMKLLYE